MTHRSVGSAHRKRVWFAVESSTDVRLLEGFAESFELTVLVRRKSAGSAISQPPAMDIPVLALATSRIAYVVRLFIELIEKRRTFDIVVVQGYGLAALAVNLAGLFACFPTVMIVCSPHEEYYRCRRLDKTAARPFHLYGLLGLCVLGRINALIGQEYIVLSKYLATVVRSHGARQPISVCPVYGVDTKVFQPAHQPMAEMRHTLGLPAEGSLIFFSSRIAPEKDVDTLLEALGILLDDGRDVWLVNASGGYLDLLERAREHNVERRLIARPAVDPRLDLASYYQVADLCVQASRAEGLGFSPLEALSCGTPVVAASVGGLRETILEESTGWTYPPGDPFALARALALALDNPDEATGRAARGRELVLQRYDRAVAFGKAHDLLDQIAGGMPANS